MGVDDFASMREVVTRRYKRIQEEKKKMPSLVLIDGGLGQLHAAAEALESLEIINQPLAAIAKREEIIYVYGQESEPVALDHHSPVLHLVQLIRDEAHRFAVTFHRKRRQMRDRATELREIPGVGESTTRRLLQHFGSVQAVKQADSAALSAVVTRSPRRRRFWITSGSRTRRCNSCTRTFTAEIAEDAEKNWGCSANSVYSVMAFLSGNPLPEKRSGWPILHSHTLCLELHP